MMNTDSQYKGDWSLPIGAYSQVPRRTHCPIRINGECGNSYIDDKWSEGGFNGQRHIVYKVQNADNSTDTPLTIHAVEADGVTLVGEPTILLEHNSEDSGSIEAPSIYKTKDSKYVLTFSKGNTATPEYTVSYAVASYVRGPYIRKGDLLKTGDYGLNGPGGADLNFNGERMLFHEMGQPIGKPYDNFRVMHAADIDVVDETGEIRLLAV